MPLHKAHSAANLTLRILMTQVSAPALSSLHLEVVFLHTPVPCTGHNIRMSHLGFLGAQLGLESRGNLGGKTIEYGTWDGSNLAL